jgi:hypothetical protein
MQTQGLFQSNSWTSFAIVDFRCAISSFPTIHPHSTGNMLQLWVSSPYGKYEFAWLKEYGNVYRLKGCFGVSPSSSSCLLR